MQGTIYKYNFTNEVQDFPVGNVVLVASQNGSSLPTIWIRHNQQTILDWEYANKDTYKAIGTGQPFDNDGMDHVGSCVCGDYVWHIYRMQ